MLKNIRAYKNTQIDWAKSQANIMKLLEARSIMTIRFTTLGWDEVKKAGVEMDKDTYALMLEFMKPVDMGTIPVRVVIPNMPMNNEKIRNQAYRIFFWYLKTKFEAVDTGLVEFEQEFMAHIALGKGSGLRNVWHLFKEKMLPQIASGESADIKFLESPKKE